MPTNTEAVGIAAYSLAQQILAYLNEKQIMPDEDLDALIRRAMHPLVGTTGGPQLNAEAGSLVGALRTTFAKARASRQGG